MKLAGSNKILIIRLSSFGDVLLSTPLIRSIKKKYPKIKIDFIVREDYKDLVKNNPHLNKVYPHADSHFERHSLINSLIAEDYDLILDLQNNFRSKEITRVLKCPNLKFRKKNFEKYLLVKFKINRLKHLPPVPVRYAEVLENFELDDEGLELISMNKPDERFQPGKIYIGLCPGSQHFTKRWPEEYYISLGKLFEQKGFNVVLFGGFDDMVLCKKIADKLNSPLNLNNEDNLLQTAADMKMCKLIYCNDSGLMHLATAVKIPVVAFFGSTVKEFGFFPYKSKSIVLENESLKCRPCTHIGRKSCPKKHFKCLKEITPESAFSNLKNLIQMV